MDYQDPNNGSLLPRRERGGSRKSLSPHVSPRHSRRGTPQTSRQTSPQTSVDMHNISAHNVGTSPKHGSRHDIRYIAGAEEITAHKKGHLGRGSQRGSRELLAGSRGGSQRSQKEVNEVVGLMHDNLEALMVRDHKLESQSRRQSCLEDNGSEWNPRGRMSKKKERSCPGYKFWLFLFALIFLLACFGGAGYIIYFFLNQNQNQNQNHLKDPRYANGAHHDWSVHDSWENKEEPGSQTQVEWVKSGGIWSKGEKTGGRNVVVKVKGDFVPGEEEVPPGELPHGHSPMK